MKRESQFPPGWDEERVRSVLEYYESQTEDEAVAEHEAAYEDPDARDDGNSQGTGSCRQCAPRETRQSTVNANRKLIVPLRAGNPGRDQPGVG